MSDLVLYTDKEFISPYAMSVYVALKEKELDFSTQTVDLDVADNRTPRYIAINPTEKIPCLKLASGQVLFESMAITEFLEDFYAEGTQHLYSQNPIEKAICRGVQSLVKSDFLTIKRVMPSTTVFGLAKPNVSFSEELEREIRKLIRVAQSVIKGEWIGEYWSIADLDFAFMLNRLAKNDIPLTVELKDYIARNWERPSVQSWMDRRQSLGK